MDLKQTLKQLEALGNEKMRAQNTKNGAGENQFGVRRGDLRALAKKIKTNHELALALWETGNIDAQFLAILLIKPKSLSAAEVDQMVRSVTFVEVADWLSNYVVKKHPYKETLRQDWMAADDPMASRAGWNLTSERGRFESNRLPQLNLTPRRTNKTSPVCHRPRLVHPHCCEFKGFFTVNFTRA